MQSSVTSRVKLKENNAAAFGALERKWNRQLTGPILPAGPKNAVWGPTRVGEFKMDSF